MSKHVAISPEEGADRLAIRELVEAYSHCADRRDAKDPSHGRVTSTSTAVIQREFARPTLRMLMESQAVRQAVVQIQGATGKNVDVASSCQHEI
jgi:hypothetical protein